MGERRTVPLGSILERLIDHRGRTPKKLGGDFTPTGVRVISANGIHDGRVTDDDVRFVSREMFRKWMPHPLRPGDVIVTSEAPLGEVAYWRSSEPVCLGQRLFALRAERDVTEPRYLYYVLRSPDVQDQLHARATGTTAQGIRQAELVRIMVDLPPLHEQVAVAEMLGSLDDKIDVNRRAARILDETARALFTSWFLDFDPVRGSTTLPDGIRRLFPERLVHSQVGPVPEAWEVSEVSAVVSVSRATIDPRQHPDEEFEHFSIPAFDGERMPSIDVGASIKSIKLEVPPDSVLLSKLNPRIPRVWWPHEASYRRRIASTEFVPCVPRQPITRTYVYGLFTSPIFQATLASLVRGTSGSHQRVSVVDLLRIPVVVPSGEVVALFDSFVAPMFQLRESLSSENQTLSDLRDTLLPALVSGDVQLDAAGHASADRLEAATAAP